MSRKRKPPKKARPKRRKSWSDQSVSKDVTFSPKVGIFWLFGNKLLFDTTHLDGAEPYGDCKGHPRGHLRHWTQLQIAGIVPRDVEYEENPRGRVIFDTKREKFLVLADNCILKRPGLIKKIMNELQLPEAHTETDKDAHYSCYKCEGYHL